MANPQKEAGYTPISNELLDAIYRTNFTATELKVLLFILRYTYGFSRKECETSLTFISKGVGISKRYISSTVSKLVDDNVLVIVKEHTDIQSRVIKINKNYDNWNNRTIVQQMKQSSPDELNGTTTDEVEFTTPDDLQFITTDEPEFHQDKQTLKQTLNKVHSTHPQKHKYGEYQHVLLTDEEKERLLSEYGQELFDKCITKLDEYIEMKGYKAKNHNLCIRKWVLDAVKKDEEADKAKGGRKAYGETYDTGNCYSQEYYRQFT